MRLCHVLPVAGLLALAACSDAVPPPADTSAPPPPQMAPAIPRLSGKPTSPLDLDLWFESEPKSGETVKVGLSVTPRVDLPDVELGFVVPGNLPVVSGDREWRGPLARDRRQTIFLTIRVPDDRRHSLRGRTHAALADGTHLHREAELVINRLAPEDGPVGKSAPAEPTGTLKTNDRGEPILEFPAETRKGP